MPNRRHVLGDRVVIRPGCAVPLTREWGCALPPHVAYLVADIDDDGRRALELRDSEDKYVGHAWPSEVWLADGPAERLQLRFERMEREIEAMKAARRAEKKARKGRKASYAS